MGAFGDLLQGLCVYILSNPAPTSPRLRIAERKFLLKKSKNKTQKN